MTPDDGDLKTPQLKKLPATRRSAVSLSQPCLIEADYLRSGRIPLVVQPKLDGLNLAGWIKSNTAFVYENLLKCGGILFRGFEMSAAEDFERVLDAFGIELMHYMEGATPRTQLSDKVYTSTEYPPEQSIALHNELSYVITWPMKIWFFCVVPADCGGETPIADVRNVCKHISPKTVARFVEKGWMLARNFGDGLSLPWQRAFRTDDRSQVEAYCRVADMDYQWKSGDRLRTRQVRPAIARHPVTGDVVWFNHIAFWHILSLEPAVREAMLAQFSEDDLPYNTCYGDGSPIEAEVIDEIREAYGRETVEFRWRRGDVLMLDNMLVAHGRNPFAGARKVLVSMGEPCNRRGI